MPWPTSQLTWEERRERQRVYLFDSAALGSLLLIAIALSFVTYGLFHSFTDHRLMLQARWRARGEAALAAGRPQVAIDDLHSALAYAPDDNGLQIELAKALAAAGRTQEAQVYFNTLLEDEPGSGDINLQLARLAAQANNPQAAVDFFQSAIDGTWNGDAFTQRRAIRLELAHYLIAQGRDAEARNLLLITSGNGPENYPLQIEVGGLLEQADGPADALDVYKRAAAHKGTRLQGLLGEAHAAEALSRYAQERTLLTQAAADPGFSKLDPQTRDGARARLREAEAVLAMFPSEALSNNERAQRISRIAEVAEQRLLACPAGRDAPAPAGPDAKPAPTGPDARGTALSALSGLADHLQQLNPLARKASPALPAVMPTATLANLAARWTALPSGPDLARMLANDPGLAGTVLELAYETERATAGSCGPATGDADLLERIARAPGQVEAQA